MAVIAATLSTAFAVLAVAGAQGTKPLSELKEWRRPLYQQGGAEAFMAYAVFGNLDRLQVSRSRYRTNGLPSGVSARSGAGCKELRSGSFASTLAKDEPALVAAVTSAP